MRDGGGNDDVVDDAGAGTASGEGVVGGSGGGAGVALLATGVLLAGRPMMAARVARVLMSAKAAVRPMASRKGRSVQPGLKAARGQVCPRRLPSSSAAPTCSVSRFFLLVVK